MTRKQKWKAEQEQVEKRNPTRQFVRPRLMRTTLRTNDFDRFRHRLRRIVGEEFPRRIDIVIGNLDPHTADGIGIKPVHLHDMFVLDIGRNTRCFEPRPKEMRFFRLAECRDRFHRFYFTLSVARFFFRFWCLAAAQVSSPPGLFQT